jgi:hypothetical protein
VHGKDADLDALDDSTVSEAPPASRRRARAGGPQGRPAVPLDSAIEAALAAPDVDAVTRVQLDEARGTLAGRRSERPEVHAATTLSDALFGFVMPHLRHPEVLRSERQLALLEQLAAELARREGDSVVREGALVVYRELRRLALLRQHGNSLVQG